MQFSQTLNACTQVWGRVHEAKLSRYLVDKSGKKSNNSFPSSKLTTDIYNLHLLSCFLLPYSLCQCFVNTLPVGNMFHSYQDKKSAIDLLRVNALFWLRECAPMHCAHLLVEGAAHVTGGDCQRRTGSGPAIS